MALRNPLAPVVLALILSGAAEAGEYQAPRNAFGQPDLEGIWTNTSATMLQRPPNQKSLVLTEVEAAQQEAMFRRFLADVLSEEPVDVTSPPPVVKEVANSDWLEMDLSLARIRGEIRSSWIVDPPDGQLPFSEAGRAASRAAAQRHRGNFDGPEARPPEERCLTAIGSPDGPPMLNTGFNGHYQIVQTPEHVAILIEMNHDVRIVRLKDHARPPPQVRFWLGDSIGRWEGETLVVETTNLHPSGRVATLGGSWAYSEKARIVERFTRIAEDQMLYEFTIEDPETFTRPWRGEMPFRPAKGPIYEYACHEGNYSLTNILAGARVQEAAAGR